MGPSPGEPQAHAEFHGRKVTLLKFQWVDAASDLINRVESQALNMEAIKADLCLRQPLANGLDKGRRPVDGDDLDSQTPFFTQHLKEGCQRFRALAFAGQATRRRLWSTTTIKYR